MLRFYPRHYGIWTGVTGGGENLLSQKLSFESSSPSFESYQDLDSSSTGRVPGLQQPRRRDDRQCQAQIFPLCHISSSDFSHFPSKIQQASDFGLLEGGDWGEFSKPLTDQFDRACDESSIFSKAQWWWSNANDLRCLMAHGADLRELSPRIWLDLITSFLHLSPLCFGKVWSRIVEALYEALVFTL